MITVDEFVDAAAVDGEATVSRAELRTLWETWFGDESPGSDSGWESFIDVIEATLDQEPDIELHFGGAWTIRARSALVKAALSSGLVVGALALIGTGGLPAIVLPAVVPLLFDLDTVDLSAGDKYIVAHLRLQEGFREGAMTADQVYAALPDDVQARMSRADLADFIDRCAKAGVADAKNETVLFRDPAKPKFRVTFS